jgi:hypothetical protein
VNHEESYELPLRGLVSSLARTHPQTASELVRVEGQFGAQAAFHAAEVILCLQARVDTFGVEAAGVLSEDDLEALPYFTLMADNLPALERLVDVLECHAAECQAVYLREVN